MHKELDILDKELKDTNYPPVTSLSRENNLQELFKSFLSKNVKNSETSEVVRNKALCLLIEKLEDKNTEKSISQLLNIVSKMSETTTDSLMAFKQETGVTNNWFATPSGDKGLAGNALGSESLTYDKHSLLQIEKAVNFVNQNRERISEKEIIEVTSTTNE